MTANTKTTQQSVPYSEDAEKAVLGCMLAQPNEVIDEVEKSRLRKFDFFVPAHQEIFGAIRDMKAAGTAIDVTTVHQHLTDHNLAESVGSPGILGDLLVGFATHLNVGSYMKIVKDKSMLRFLQESCELTLRTIRETPDSVASVLKGHRHSVDRLTEEFEDIINPDRVLSWGEAFNRAIMPSTEVEKLNLKARPAILGQWMKEGDLGFIYGPRGLGKTWLAMHMACGISGGGKVGPWTVQEPRKVLYVDGEMAIDASIERKYKLAQGREENLLMLHHEVLFHTTGKVLNLTDPNVQDELTKQCLAHGVKVMVLDNISCLLTLKENDSDDWGDKVLPWLLRLRRERVAIVFVHHAGRNGAMRGTSKREDAAFWSIKLTEAKASEDTAGARFGSTFDKNRNTTDEEAPPIQWHFEPQRDGSVIPHWKASNLMEVFLGLLDDGLTTCTDIAEELKASKATISRLAKKAEAAGKIGINGREYTLKK